MRTDDRWGGNATPMLLLECLDFTDVLNGTDPEALAVGNVLRDVFATYGDLKRLRVFPEQEAAAIEFAEAGSAARVPPPLRPSVLAQLRSRRTVMTEALTARSMLHDRTEPAYRVISSAAPFMHVTTQCLQRSTQLYLKRHAGRELSDDRPPQLRRPPGRGNRPRLGRTAGWWGESPCA